MALFDDEGLPRTGIIVRFSGGNIVLEQAQLQIAPEWRPETLWGVG